jgi:hypothetical protein
MSRSTRAQARDAEPVEVVDLLDESADVAGVPVGADDLAQGLDGLADVVLPHARP